MNTTAPLTLPASASQDQRLATSSTRCRLVAKKHAKNFYYGLKLTPEPKRSAMYAIYAWMRTADDLADAAGGAADKIDRLEMLRRRTLAAIDPQASMMAGEPQDYDWIWPAVRKAVLDFRIPVSYLHAMIDGQLIDQRQTRYDSFEQLYDYCYKVASVVGLVCITVWGYTGGQATQKLAEFRGIGLQLTNILRDVVEDARRGRVYLPADELERHGYSPDTFSQQVLAGCGGPAFDRLMAQQVSRARRYYDLSEALERHLDPGCRPASWAMAHTYGRLLNRISRHPRRVLTGAVRLGRMEKLSVALRAAWGSGLHG